ncbi:YybH family protein [Gimesia panareensis]|uniref:YybH family protein n=1 Tax=Gimesia panareensis TaxID=2527978 RepID=UPI0018D5E4E3|nr:SgcJ/EcaC family oxidoreductase [Gimesia panareensis]
MKKQQDHALTSDAEQAIKKMEAAFQKAFDTGNAAKVASFWVPEGELIDANGLRLAGRPEIQRAYADYFTKNKGVKLQISIDSVRQIGENMAIEEGRTVVTVPRAVPDYSRYTATHMKRDGKWQTVSVKEEFVMPPTVPQDKLMDLEWLIGTWTVENEGVTLMTVYQWMPGKKFMQRTFTSKSGSKTQLIGRQIIGVDPLSEDIMSWTFNVDGSHAVGIWTPVDNGWAIESCGVTASGMLTSSNNIISKIDENGCRWQSVNRWANGDELPDALEVVSKRKK